MKEKISRNKNKIIALALVIVSVMTIVYLSKTKKPPAKKTFENKKVVKTIKAKAQDADIFIKSFGTIKSDEDLELFSSISADILYRSKNLIEGKFVKKGELLLSFDDREYKLNVQNLQANILQAKAFKKDLELELINTKRALKIEKQRLLIDEKDLQRYTNLGDQISASELARYKNIVLSRKNSLQSIKTKIDSLPLKIKSQDAQIKALEAQKEIAQLSLDDCNIYMPFDGIVYDIKIEKNQYVNKSQHLFNAYNSNKMQIELEISLSQLSKFDNPNNLSNIKTILYSPSLKKYYKADFLNISKNINEKTRTTKLLFKIDEAVFKGIFLEAKIKANTLQNVFIVPKTSYTKGKVYLEKEEKLIFKKVEILNEKEDSFIVKGLEENDNLIISYIPDAIEGMSLKVSK